MLIRIDPADYKINIAKLKASIRNFQVKIQQIELEKTNNLKLLELQQVNLDFKLKELQRRETLKKKSLVTSTEYEAQLLAVNAQEVQIQNLHFVLILKNG